MSLKNEKIKETMAKNKLRRSSLDMKVFVLKADESHLSKQARKRLELSFIQAKWLYNDSLSKDNIFTRDYKDTKVVVLKYNPDTQKCDIPEERSIELGSQIVQSLIKRTQQNIINLNKAKKKGFKAGSLDYAKEVRSIPLKQFRSTHRLSGKNHMRIQGIGRIKFNGMSQLEGKELASAILYRDASGFYLKVLTYSPKEARKITNGVVGLDFGIKNGITLSNGEQYSWDFPIPDKIKRKQRSLSRKVHKSRNYVKQLNKIQKNFIQYRNQKDDAANKFVSHLKDFEKVIIQDENLKGWHSGFFGKQIQQSILGRIKAKILNLETSIVIDRWLPTTKISPVTFKNIRLGLSDRVFMDGDFIEDRDIKSAKTVLCFGLYNPSLTSKELRSLPVEELTSIFSNYKFENNKLIPAKQEATVL